MRRTEIGCDEMSPDRNGVYMPYYLIHYPFTSTVAILPLTCSENVRDPQGKVQDRQMLV